MLRLDIFNFLAAFTDLCVNGSTRATRRNVRLRTMRTASSSTLSTVKRFQKLAFPRAVHLGRPRAHGVRDGIGPLVGCVCPLGN